jgi:hypothetical protein
MRSCKVAISFNNSNTGKLDNSILDIKIRMMGGSKPNQHGSVLCGDRGRLCNDIILQN